MKEEGKRKKRRAQVSHKGGSGERNQPEREEDRSRWRGWCPEPTLCPVPCSLALYAAPHPTPGSRQRGGKQGRGGGRGGRTPGKEGTTPTAQGTDGHGTHKERQGQGI